MNPVPVIYFPKPCPHCKEPMEAIKKMSARWLECKNEKCPFPQNDPHERTFRYAYSPC